MINNDAFVTFDWGDEILYSGSFNLYSNQFSIKDIGWYRLIFSFSRQQNQAEWKITITPDKDNKIIRIDFDNFWSDIWAATQDKVSIMQIWWKDILFSVYWSIVSWTSILSITLTIYKRG